MTNDPGADGRQVGGRYRLLRSLGRGGMGVVWAAHDGLLDREVAVKEVTYPTTLDEAQQAQLRERTLREARAAARISSSAAVTVYDVVEEDGRPWIVMELLPARSLADVLREDGPLTTDAATLLGLRLLDALSAAHAAGVLHRDVKPANVLYDASDRPSSPTSASPRWRATRR
ncbi:serine/threonine-protein kinase [Jannaschia sp. R86511]|uniref:serine/threonine-protein kinase n=1 Tax=Jannaschia sp. R86511 TaxID=3093853 RepID=UPI0036D36FA3